MERAKRVPTHDWDQRKSSFFSSKLVAVATLFIFVFFNTCIPNHIHTMILYIRPSPFAEASLQVSFARSHFRAQKSLDFREPPLQWPSPSRPTQTALCTVQNNLEINSDMKSA